MGGTGEDALRVTDRSPALHVDEIVDADDPRFEELYGLYERLFPLPAEREPPEAFFEVLALNRNPQVQHALGPWHEAILVVQAGQGGPVVGGHVYGVTTSRAHRELGCAASVQAIYTFFDHLVRGRTPMSQIERELQARASRTFDDRGAPITISPLIFVEVNNPLRMTPEQIADDTAHAGIDPYRRYRHWLNSGLRPLELSYVQPPLRTGEDAVRYLDLFCNSSLSSVPSSVILGHLRAFISISVLKGRPADDDPDFAVMRDQLGVRDAIGFVPEDQGDLRAIRERAAELKLASQPGPGVS
ncbi:MAG TPA: hypothetical protein VGD37_43415 [Kofleriaceae bacterium]|jgi:hypothetical protein